MTRERCRQRSHAVARLVFSKGEIAIEGKALFQRAALLTAMRNHAIEWQPRAMMTADRAAVLINHANELFYYRLATLRPGVCGESVETLPEQKQLR